MSPSDTASNGTARRGAGTARRRAIATVMGAGVLAAIPLTVHAADPTTGALAKGDRVVPTATTPAAVKTAIRSGKTVVVAFLLPGFTEDEIVQKRLNTLRKQPKFNDTTFIVYRINGGTRLGDLPTMFGVKYTPHVTVIRSDDKLASVWRGLVDEDIIAQSVLDARAAVPRAVRVTAPTGPTSGNAAGIALANRVNARYVQVKGISLASTAGGVSATSQIRLVQGKIRLWGGDGSLVGVGKGTFVVNPTGAYLKGGGAACFTRSTRAAGLRSLGNPVIAVRGVRFGKPVKSADGSTWTLTGIGKRGQYGGGSIQYTIDVKTLNLVSKADPAGTATVTNLDAAPAIAKPDPLC